VDFGVDHLLKKFPEIKVGKILQLKYIHDMRDTHYVIFGNQFPFHIVWQEIAMCVAHITNIKIKRIKCMSK